MSEAYSTVVQLTKMLHDLSPTAASENSASLDLNLTGSMAQAWVTSGDASKRSGKEATRAKVWPPRAGRACVKKCKDVPPVVDRLLAQLRAAGAPAARVSELRREFEQKTDVRR